MTQRFPEPTFPTPLRRVPELSHELAEVWLKNDGYTHPVYGGNKTRKIGALLAAAERRGVQRVLTFGAAGSHHVLTTTLFARARGLRCAAMLTPQVRTEHAVDTLRAALGAGLEAFPAPTNLSVPLALARALRAGDALIPPGASSPLGASAYADAVGELAQQLEESGAAPPDCIVVPLGTGGTTAGLLAGTALHRVPATVLGISILKNPFARTLIERLAHAIISQRGGAAPAHLGAQLTLDDGFIGRGYGHSTAEGDAATARAALLGLELDQTYTAKALAAVLDLTGRIRQAGRSRPMRIVYWHTLSAVSLKPLLEQAPAFGDLPRDAQRLFVEPAH